MYIIVLPILKQKIQSSLCNVHLLIKFDLTFLTKVNEWLWPLWSLQTEKYGSQSEFDVVSYLVKIRYHYCKVASVIHLVLQYAWLVFLIVNDH